MSLICLPQNPAALGEQLHDALAVTPALIADVIREACRRFPSQGQPGKTERVEQLIQLGAWTDAALALLELELPQWRIRRLVYDDGEWHCALSRERELPDWLDHLHIRNLRIGQSRIGLDFTRRGERTFCNVVDVEGEKMLVNVAFKK